MITENKEKLVQAKKLIDSGHKAEARQIIISVLKENSGNANAWVLAAMASDDEAQKQKALDRALQIDPFHKMATQLYEPYQQPTPVAPVGFEKKRATGSRDTQKKKSEKSWGNYLFTFIGIILIIAFRLYLRGYF
ncbi:MAG: DUF4192 domain-containing protein [Anaerolineae bacterium]|nr:DUF4192 domain-containing protein [Anaerolineae bacterium]